MGAVDEPAVVVRDLTGQLMAWIEVGAPSVERLHKGAKAAPRCALYTHRDPAQLLATYAGQKIHRAAEIPLYSFGREFTATVAVALPRSAFRTATIADLNNGIVGRNTFFRDGQKVVDINITKFFEMPWEGHRLMLRADLLNAFNHVWYGTPVNDIAATNFGAITTTNALYTPRVVQVALRYTF